MGWDGEYGESSIMVLGAWEMTEFKRLGGGGGCFSRYPCLIHVCHMLSQHFHFFYQPVVLFDQLLSVISTDPLGSAVLSHCPLILLCREELPQPTTLYIWIHQREVITLVLGHWTDNHISKIKCTQAVRQLCPLEIFHTLFYLFIIIIFLF